MSKHTFAVLLFASTLAAIPLAHAAVPPQWSASWTAPPDSPGPALQAQTVRQIVRTSVGGAQVRIRLSNLYGAAPLTIGAAHLALHADGAAIRPGSDRALRFDGAASVTIAPGASTLSDPLDLAVAPLQELAVSLYLPDVVPVATLHGAGMQTAYRTAGDTTAALTPPAGKTDDSRYFLTDVEVLGARAAATLVVVGDSITDGVGAGDDRNARWTDVLAARLQREPALAHVAVVNAGIAGNRIVNNAAKPFVGASVLTRFERDALSKPGVRWILLHEGINDITAGPFLHTAREQVSVEQISAAMRTLAARARAQGVRIWAGTLTPFEGTRGFYNEANENGRQALNAWIRTGSAFDAVVDFDAALRDPDHPTRLAAAFDSGDHLHPNAAGYEAMAAALDVGMLRAAPRKDLASRAGDAPNNRP